jgi:2-polyprenyl-3-methyl-5-hydroxy-6-metoxy-1,4-benzoquinol methylase/ribosomal protein S27E
MKTWSTPVPAAHSGLVSQAAAPIPCALCGGRVFRPALRCEGFHYVRCGGCGLVQMNPQPGTASVHERYGSVHGNDYLRYEHANEAAFLALQMKTLEDASLDEERERFFSGGKRRFLDIGCATGALLEKMRESGWDASGVEISAQMAEYGRKNRNLVISTLPLEETGFAEKHFIVVHASHLIEHLNRPGLFVREVYRILDDGGLFLVTTPNIAGIQARLSGGKWRSAIYDHLYLFSTGTLTALLRREGFHIEKVVTWGGIAKGAAPALIKKTADRLAKKTGYGDVMMIKARKQID